MTWSLPTSRVHPQPIELAWSIHGCAGPGSGSGPDPGGPGLSAASVPGRGRRRRSGRLRGLGPGVVHPDGLQPRGAGDRGEADAVTDLDLVGRATVTPRVATVATRAAARRWHAAGGTD